MILKFGFLLVNKKNKAGKKLSKTEWEWVLSQRERRGRFPHPA
jgi:hypothetical protein